MGKTAEQLSGNGGSDYEKTSDCDSFAGFAGCNYVGSLFVRSEQQPRKTKKESEDAAALQLVDFNSSNINKIEIQTPDGDDYTAVIGAESNVWELTEDTDFHINVYFLNSVAGSLCNLTATENLGVATEDIKKQYELDNPYTITLSTDDDSVHCTRENSPQRRSTII